MEMTKSQACFGGEIQYYTHQSEANNAPMNFAVFLPPQIEDQTVPVLYWLSGLTCTEDNFMAKAGAQRIAAELGIMLVSMDTSPRNLDIPGENDSYDFGSGAGFYVNATQKPWSHNYHMYDYVSMELPRIIEAYFDVDPERKSIFGHSMGGHGALMIALRNIDVYRSVSAFAPIVAPTQCPWGQKAFRGYLGDDESAWADYDTCLLLPKATKIIPILIDQGTEDEFMSEQLMPEKFEQKSQVMGYPETLRMQPGYDHSYYFIATFIEDHLRFHAQYLFYD
ncbi:S-formylglutathione hydrolase [Marinicella sp. W31]|uniref:S-formylglutathione hydrolase n=1 Tax=Marinicella sp. W31 TaxID=3023713 RepID=UPI00375725B1